MKNGFEGFSLHKRRKGTREKEGGSAHPHCLSPESPDLLFTASGCAKKLRRERSPLGMCNAAQKARHHQPNVPDSVGRYRALPRRPNSGILIAVFIDVSSTVQATTQHTPKRNETVSRASKEFRKME